jgi:hypothetical protein
MIAIVSSTSKPSPKQAPRRFCARALMHGSGCNLNAGGVHQLINKSLCCLVLLAALGTPRVAAAQKALGQFLGGAAVGLAAHEAGHLLVDAIAGADVGLKKVTAGPIPFFAITHQSVTPGREFAISSAGFWVQHATNELILTRRPQLKSERAPFVKGVVAFNVLTSIGYSVAAFAQRGPAERDTRGMAVSARIDEPWIGATVLAPALLDGARYYKPEVAWLKWASRAAKIGGAVLIVRAAG